jgi:hypothetical protein
MSQLKIEEYYMFLEMLISKHNEQSASYYKRLTFYFTLITIIIVGLSTIANAEKVYNEETRSFCLITISLIGLILSVFWVFILNASNKWLLYWRAKIYLFEEKNMKNHNLQYYSMFMLDRVREEQYQENLTQVEKDYINHKVKINEYRPKIHQLFTILLYFMALMFGSILIVIFWF